MNDLDLVRLIRAAGIGLADLEAEADLLNQIIANANPNSPLAKAATISLGQVYQLMDDLQTPDDGP